MLWSASFIQIVLLWAWHGQAVQDFAQASAVITLLLQAGLLIAALVFWCAVIVSAARPWQTILALLISGKLACLLGVLLVFSPRLLLSTSAAGDSAMSDQHLAGLLMLAACPLSHILAAIVLTARQISGLEQRHGAIRQDRSPIGG